MTSPNKRRKLTRIRPSYPEVLDALILRLANLSKGWKADIGPCEVTQSIDFAARELLRALFNTGY